MWEILNPWAQATDGVFRGPWCQSTDGIFCPAQERPRPGGGRKRYRADDVDLEELKARARRRRDQRDLRDLEAIIRILAKTLR